MQYRTAFDIATSGYKSWDFPATGLILIVLGVLLVMNRKRLPGRWKRSPKSGNVFALFFLGFAVLWTLSAFCFTFGEYSSLVKSVSNNNVHTVEGIVANFKPMPFSGHAMERFCVTSACFEYSDFVVTGGFNNTASHGGPIREGLPVRVTFVGNSILKLEVAK